MNTPVPSRAAGPHIACVHIPRFAVEAERQRRKDAASRLILIGEGAVFDCSLGAEVSNVRRGMRMSEAIGLCPRAVVLPTDLPYYERLFGEILDFLETFSPAVEGAGLGTAYLSLAGLAVDQPSFAEELIAAMHRRFGFMPAVGIANGKFTARVAAETARPGVAKLIPPGEEIAFLAPLSIEHLPATDAMRWRLGLLGLTTLGDVARLPLGAFQSQFGPEGKRFWELARGIDGEPLTPRVCEETVVRRLEMPAPAANLDAILMGVERLVHAAYAGIEGGRWVRKIIVRAALDAGGAWELPIAFREALSDPGQAWFAVKAAIMRRPPERPVEELEVELVGLSGESGKQATMFEGKGKLWRQIEEAVRQLEVQKTKPPIGRVVAVEPWSRIPERRSALADFDL
ncbi:MAG: DNA polymerase Y family protein [Dehalococcoidia bacterium]|nr:DNA polymerase Y family protein [Dehalococcoidia bacterium]